MCEVAKQRGIEAADGTKGSVDLKIGLFRWAYYDDKGPKM